MTGFAPTGEQQDIVDAAGTGANLTIEAGAGTGKTSTLQFLADRLTGKRGLYIAYNKAIQREAERKFPSSVTCKTAHGLAFGPVGRNFRHRLDAPRVPAYRAAQLLRITEPVKLGGVVADQDVTLTEKQLARLVMETIQKFCYSNDAEITPWHVPYVTGVARDAQRELARYLAPIAQRAWDEDITQKNGNLRFTHDAYLKMFCLTNPQLPFDYVLLDEAQDSNGSVAGLVERQRHQKILVGDRCQSIYQWRGATDAMEKFEGQRFYLTQSFRFGPAIADEANKWLSLIDGAVLRLTGFDQIPSRLAELDAPDAVLCRSNGGAISRVIAELDKGRRAALVGGGADIKRFAEAAEQLEAGRPTDHPELMAFSAWAEVQEYVQSGEGSDMKVLVNLVDRHGSRELAGLVDRLTDERYADVTISTAHKAKGREWHKVQIASDFPPPKGDEDKGIEPRVAREDAMLAYVAVTRAQHVLDREGLAWVDEFAAATPAAPTVSAIPAPAAPVVIAAPAPVVDDEPDPCDGYDPYCRRCKRYFRKCTCAVMPDRRPLVAAR
ncbi:UvrD-helicase domain-containing protein [Micromonospora sp. WMMD737]|uniref:UvrD-helicase domain-containing protein n=1 Tax=Micromonospora sp. WMMD737 TaxID=3404113 RepID=UPI003B9270CE